MLCAKMIGACRDGKRAEAGKAELMVKSVLGGTLTGAFVATIGLGTASLIAPQPAGNTPPTPAPQQSAPDAAQTAQPSSDAAIAPTPEAAPSGSVPAPAEPEQPEPAQSDAASGIDTASAPRPGPADTPTAGAVPPADSAAPSVSATAPVLPSPQASAPAEPRPEGDLSISTDPAQPVLPDVGEDSFIALPTAPAESAVTPETTGETTTEPTGESVGDPTDETAPPAVLTRPRPPVRETENAGTLAPEPSLFDDDTPAADGASDAAQDTPADPPRIAHAAAYERQADMPVLSVILIDDARIGLGAEAIAALPLPVTMAIDPAQDGAADRLDGYRQQGIEVLALTDIPAAATAQDAAIQVEATMAQLPPAIGLLDLDMNGVGGDALSAATDLLARDGYSLVTLDAGLNSAARAAERAGLPSARILRDLDANGQDARTIRRFLDQAAFRARNDGQVVVLARLRPDTVSALDLWSLAERAQTVQILPVSAQINPVADPE